MTSEVRADRKAMVTQKITPNKRAEQKSISECTAHGVLRWMRYDSREHFGFHSCQQFKVVFSPNLSSYPTLNLHHSSYRKRSFFFKFSYTSFQFHPEPTEICDYLLCHSIPPSLSSTGVHALAFSVGFYDS